MEDARPPSKGEGHHATMSPLHIRLIGEEKLGQIYIAGGLTPILYKVELSHNEQMHVARPHETDFSFTRLPSDSHQRLERWSHP